MSRIAIILEDYFFPLSNFYYWRGLSNGYLGRFAESESDFLNVIKGNELNGDNGAWAAYVDLAWVYFQQGKFEEIKESIGKVIVVYPDNPWILTMYGIALFNLGEVEEAQEYTNRAFIAGEKLEPEDWAQSYPGNDPEEAEQGLRQLMEAIQYNKDIVTE